MKKVGAIVFVILTFMLCVGYMEMLRLKIAYPTIKNMNDRGAVWFGIVAFALLVTDIYIAYRLIRNAKRN